MSSAEELEPEAIIDLHCPFDVVERFLIVFSTRTMDEQTGTTVGSQNLVRRPIAVRLTGAHHGFDVWDARVLAWTSALPLPYWRHSSRLASAAAALHRRARGDQP